MKPERPLAVRRPRRVLACRSQPMSRRHVAVLTALAVALMWVKPAAQQAGEWTHYGGNAASQKYSPLDGFNRDTI